MSKSGDKPLMCADCGAHFIRWTNHHNDTWNNCKDCGMGNSRSLCMTKEGIALRQKERDNKIELEIVTYCFDVSQDEDRLAYTMLKKGMDILGVKLWEVHHFQSSPIKHLLKRFRDKEECSTNTYVHTNKIELSTVYMFSNQWLSPDGPRVFDSHEIIHPNHCIKEGYYLVITDEVRELRHNRLQCRYCGEQSLEGQVGDQHCDEKRLSSYGDPTPLEVGQLTRVRIKEQDYTVVVSLIVPYDRLDQNDKDEWGSAAAHEKTITAYSKENALDKFHSTYPIKVLEHFDICIKE